MPSTSPGPARRPRPTVRTRPAAGPSSAPTSGRTRTSTRRLRIAWVGVAVVLSVLAARLFAIQGVDSGAYAAMAADEGTRTVPLPAERGEILDRDGVALATSTEAVALVADPTLTTDTAPQVARVLHARLGLDYFDTLGALRRPDTRFVYLAHQVVTTRADAAIAALGRQGLGGVSTERDPMRTYPAEGVAANTVGLVADDGTGAAGLERAYEDELSGTDGEATYELSTDGERIPLADSTVTEPQDGQSVQTTIDRDLQWYADRRIAQAIEETGSDWGLCIVMDDKTGEVLVMSQLPTFDADRPDTIDPDDINARAVEAVYEPGSVQKVLTFAAVEDAGKVTPTSRFHVPLALQVDDYSIGDDEDPGDGRYTATGIVARSSNLGTVKASRRISENRLHDYLTSFGLGSPTGIGLPAESGGILAPASRWSDSQAATIAFGQGVSVTGIQMAAALSAIANGGVYVQPTLVTGTVDADGTEHPAPAPETHRVVSEQAASDVLQMMEAVVRDGGTGPEAQIPGYRVAGKTGTAWRVDPETGSYVPGENTISFAGIAPADDPRFTTYVVLDNPKDGSFGGTAAAPVVRDVMAMALEKYGVAPSGDKPTVTPLRW